MGAGAMIAAAVAGSGLSPGNVFAASCTWNNSPQTSTSGNTTTVTYCYNGHQGTHSSTAPSYQYFTVPAGVTSITVTANGAQGGEGAGDGVSSGKNGNKYVQTFPVTPGNTYRIAVGGQGEDANGRSGGDGGYQNARGGNSVSSGNGGGGGGGATAIWNTTSSTPILYLAAGGGGGTGGDGYRQYSTNRPGGGGGGGGGFTFTAPGTTNNAAGANGANGTGSNDGATGAQGSDWCNTTVVGAACNTPTSKGAPSGDGQLIITYTSQAPTTTTVSSNHNPSVYGQPVTFVATVSPDASTQGSAVNFKVGGTTITGCGAQQLHSNHNGTASAYCTITNFNQFHATPYWYNVTATYTNTAASPSFLGSTSAPYLQRVHRADTSVELWSDHNPSVYGQSLTFTARVTADSPSTLNPGNRGLVTFKDTTTGDVLCTNVALSGNKAQCTLSLSQIEDFHAGSHTIVAFYTDAGDSPVDYNPSSGSMAQSVNAAATTTTASAAYYDLAPVPTVGITARVVSNSPSDIDPGNVGTVSFFNGSTLLCTVPLVNGEALCISAIDPATTSPHSLTAIYNYKGLSTADYQSSSSTTDVVPHLARPTLVSVNTVYPNNGAAWLVKGGGFSGASSVTVCGVAVPFTVVNDYTLLIGIPDIVGPKQCIVTVTAAGGTGSTSNTVTVVPKPLPGAPVIVIPTGTATPSTPTTTPTPTPTTCGETVDLTLSGRWTLVAWPGADGMSVLDALAGGDCGNDITAKVSVIWGFDAATQTYQAYFPGSANVPGLNDLSTLKLGLGYWVGLVDPATSVTWTVEKG